MTQEQAAVVVDSAAGASRAAVAWKWTRAGLSAIAGLLFGMAICAAIFLFIATQFLDWHVSTIETGSMEPRLEKGDIVITRPVRMDKIDEGDIILYNERNTNVPFVHRVAGISTITQRFVDENGKFLGEATEYRYRTKGDANPSVDPYEVTFEDYQGRVWMTIPMFGIGTGGVSLQLMLLIAAGIFGIAWVSWEFFAIGRAGSKSKTKRRRRKKRTTAAPQTTASANPTAPQSEVE